MPHFPDDIYLGSEPIEDRVRQTVCAELSPDLPGKKKQTGALYFSLVDRKPRPWFDENIIKKPGEHPHIGQIGKIMLFR